MMQKLIACSYDLSLRLLPLSLLSFLLFQIADLLGDPVGKFGVRIQTGNVIIDFVAVGVLRLLIWWNGHR